MPLKKSKSKEAFKANLTELMRAGYDKDQALAISFDIQRRSGKKGRKK